MYIKLTENCYQEMDNSEGDPYVEKALSVRLGSQPSLPKKDYHRTTEDPGKQTGYQTSKKKFILI